VARIIAFVLISVVVVCRVVIIPSRGHTVVSSVPGAHVDVVLEPFALFDTVSIVGTVSV
jgi:hypothetical protein